MRKNRGFCNVIKTACFTFMLFGCLDSPQVQPGSDLTTSGWFPFTLDGLDSSATPTDLSYLNAGEAGAAGFIRVKDGHFVDGNGERIRFFGDNMVGGPGCFPDKADAPKMAAHLRKLGINVIRFGLDAAKAPRGIFAADGISIDPGQLDRFDYYFSQLKKNGIYANILLHGGGLYPGVEGDVAARFPYGKVLDRFYPDYIEIQKKYARSLIGHRNPYTGLSYAEDPAVLCFELNNENTIFPFFNTMSTAHLPEPWSGELLRQWNAWLRIHYGSDRQLVDSWRAERTGSGNELLRNAGSASVNDCTAGWGWDRYGSLQPAPGGSLRWSAPVPGANPWDIQLFQTGIPLIEGRYYTLSFQARVPPESKPGTHELSVAVQLDVSDWRNLGLSKLLTLQTDWQSFEWSFRATGTIPGHGGLNLSMQNQPGTIELRSFHLKEGAVFSLPEGSSLEAGTIPNPIDTDLQAGMSDYLRFLSDTELATIRQITDVLRGELHAGSLIVNTQVDFGGFYGLLRETAASDLIDTHAYWSSVNWPEGWTMGVSNTNWRIDNVSQIGAADAGVLGGMAALRVAGMPFTVSEYNIPSPNDHAAETLPMLSTFAAFQDWDAIYAFAHLDIGRYDWNLQMIEEWFSYAGHPGKLVFDPAAALVFRKGLVQAGKTPVTLSVPRRTEGAGTAISTLSGMWAVAGTPQKAAGTRRMQVSMIDGAGEVTASEKIKPGDTQKSDTGEIAWNSAAAGQTYTVIAPAVRLAVGQISGRRMNLGDISVEVGRLKQPYACIQFVAMDEKPIAQSSKVLVAIAARVENQGMGWNEDRSSVGDQWGIGPTVAEPVPVIITMPGRGWRAEMLDGKGAPSGNLPVVEAGPGCRVEIMNPATLWYILIRE